MAHIQTTERIYQTIQQYQPVSENGIRRRAKTNYKATTLSLNFLKNHGLVTIERAENGVNFYRCPQKNTA